MSECDICGDEKPENQLKHHIQGHICKKCEKRVKKQKENKNRKICNRCTG